MRNDVCANVSVGDAPDTMRCIATIPSSGLRKKWLAGLTHSGTRLAGGPLPRTGGPDRCLGGGVSSCREEQFALRGDPQSVLAPAMLDHDLALTLKQCSARDAA